MRSFMSISIMAILKRAMNLNNKLTEPIKELSELTKKHNEPINKLNEPIIIYVSLSGDFQGLLSMVFDTCCPDKNVPFLLKLKKHLESSYNV